MAQDTQVHSLFGLCQISLPSGWQIEQVAVQSTEQTGGPQVKECQLFDDNSDTGHLNIKCYEFPLEKEAQQQQLLGSVFAETEQETLQDGVYWGTEELTGEEEGEAIAVIRWLVCCTSDSRRFVLLTCSYSVTASDLNTDAVRAELSLLETAIKQLVWQKTD